jgi:hypothetical protein
MGLANPLGSSFAWNFCTSILLKVMIGGTVLATKMLYGALAWSRGAELMLPILS